LLSRLWRKRYVLGRERERREGGREVEEGRERTRELTLLLLLGFFLFAGSRP